MQNSSCNEFQKLLFNIPCMQAVDMGRLVRRHCPCTVRNHVYSNMNFVL